MIPKWRPLLFGFRQEIPEGEEWRNKVGLVQPVVLDLQMYKFVNKRS